MKKFILTVLASLSITAVASAQINEVSIEYDTKNSKAIISGELDSFVPYVTLEVLNPGVSFESLGGGAADMSYIYHLDQIYLEDGEKKFDFLVSFHGNTSYMSARINLPESVVANKFLLKHINIKEYSDEAEQINKIAKEETFEVFKAEYENNINLGTDTLIENTNKDEAEKLVYEYLREFPLDTENPEDALALWKKAQFITLLNVGECESIDDFTDCLELESEEESWFLAILKNQSAKKRLYELLTEQDINSLQEFNKKIREAILLTSVQYPDGYANIGKILTNFSDLTEIKEDGEIAVYKQLAGKKYSSVKELLEAYTNAKNSKKEESYKGGSSSGSGGKGSKGSGSNIGVMIPENPIVSPEVKISFVDLDTVNWAYEAISTLADKGIINGKSDTIFAPHDDITREEFVKILVCTLGLQNEVYSNTFSDVEDNAWYVSYVNIARDKSIVSGIGANMFGSGMKISRQDMAVMIYNTLLACGVEMKPGDMEFTDNESISLYAKDAVGALVNMGVINGNGDGSFAPKNNATRAEAAKMVFGILDKITAEV